MKNTFKFFSLMMVAGALLFASCTEEPATYKTPKYKITVTANNSSYGTVSGGGEYDSASTATLIATANEGYRFAGWADNNTNNPRIVTVTKDASYTANFEELSGVNVTFGTTSWSAGYVNATAGQLQNGGYAVSVAAGQTDNTSFPICRLYCSWNGTPSNGTITDSPAMYVEGNSVSIVFGQNAYLWYYENGSWDLNSSSGGVLATGDWWAKDLTLNVTAIDINAMTFSAVANASMAHVTELTNEQGQLISVDFNDVSSKDLTANIINQTLSSEKSNALKVTTKAVARLAK